MGPVQDSQNPQDQQNPLLQLLASNGGQVPYSPASVNAGLTTMGAAPGAFGSGALANAQVVPGSVPWQQQLKNMLTGAGAGMTGQAPTGGGIGGALQKFGNALQGTSSQTSPQAQGMFGQALQNAGNSLTNKIPGIDWQKVNKGLAKIFKLAGLPQPRAIGNTGNTNDSSSSTAGG